MKRSRIYNPENKERFLKTNATTPTMDALFRNVFDMIAPFEEEKGADICTWNEEDIKGILEILSGFRNYSSENRAQLLRRYIRWCINTGYHGATDAVFHTRADGMSKVREMTLSCPAHLDRCLNTIFSPVKDATNDNILRGFCWLAYSGMDESDIVNVRSNDVDLLRRRVCFNDVAYQIYEPAIPCIKILKEMSAFRFFHPSYENGYIWRPRMDGDRLLRGVRSAEPTVMMFRSKLSKLASEAFKNRKIDVKISYYRIWISGEFYRAYLRELSGITIDFNHIADRAMRLREKRGEPYKLESNNNKRTEEAKRREISTDYKDDYLRWKTAYANEL